MESDRPYREDNRWQSSSTSSSSSSSYANNGNNSSNSNLSYYAYLEETINTKAKKMTLDYLKSQGVQLQGGNQQGQQMLDQVFLVYKFIHTPIDAIIAGM